jgi:2-phosphosulfolactate phosphatase
VAGIQMAVLIDVEFVPQDSRKASERGDLIIVIDVLRASTSIITSLANNAKSVTPVQTLQEALQLKKEHSNYVLVGERNGVKIQGFNLGNSPISLTVENVQNKNLIMKTTNGTKTLIKLQGSKWVVIGAFLNASAVAKKSAEIASKNGVGISVVLAGEENHFALEDFICAGAIVERLSNSITELSDKALGALLAFNGAKQNLQKNISKSKHAQDLLKIGFSEDIEFACKIDLYNLVPFYKNGIIKI